jgi:hypothetical protein
MEQQHTNTFSGSSPGAERPSVQAPEKKRWRSPVLKQLDVDLTEGIHNHSGHDGTHNRS